MELSVGKGLNLVETTKARDRRGKIVTALYRCMAKKGYAATTLCDIAEEASMTSSHLLYYYPGKEAILEEFFKSVTKRIEKLSKAEHDLIQEVHPKVEEIKESVKDVSDKVSAQKG
jgi:AcrR family transcriptional regulator